MVALNEVKPAVEWKKIVAGAGIEPKFREYLEACRLKKVLISQAEMAWEICFQCPYEPENEIREILVQIWQEMFGRDYNFKFQFEVRAVMNNLDMVCRHYWGEILNKLTVLIPSSRGWLADAAYKVKQDELQVTIKNEVGWGYLVSRGLKVKIEEILRKDYYITAQVNVDLSPEEEEPASCVEEQILEIENGYLEKLNAARDKNRQKIVHSGEVCKEKSIMGKRITGQAVALKDVIEEEKNITVKGYVFNLDYRVLKTGRGLITFCITDKTDSLACKIITDGQNAEEIFKNLKEHKYCLMRGQVQHDRYSQELTLMPRDITTGTPVLRQDNAQEKRIELHLHTKMSALDGLCGVKDIVQQAISWGHTHLAITDHGVVQAFPEAYEAAASKIKLVYGLEGYLFDDEGMGSSGRAPTYHIIILAKDQEGLRNLYELVTISHLNYYYRVPRIPRSKLVELRKGLILGSACEAGELIRNCLRGANNEELEEIARFYDYLEIQPRGNNRFLVENGTLNSEEDILALNKTIYELGHKLGLPVVATGDVHFIEPEDEVYRRILMAGKGFEDADNQAPLYFKTTEEMLQEFSYLGEEAAYEVVIKNPRDIAAGIETIKPIPDELFPPEIQGAEEEIQRLTYRKAYEIYSNQLPQTVQKRIDKELNSIVNNGFAVLYYIAHKLVKKSNEDGYIVGSRGSVGSSLVATMCGITEVNPLPPHYRCNKCKTTQFFEDGSVGSGADMPDQQCPQCGSTLIKDGHDIPFETFLGFEGDKVPDIDLNFSGVYQPRAHKYTEELFGRDNVFRAGTIATVAKKTAFGFVKNYFEVKNKPVGSAEINRLVEGCTGVKRTTGQHPGGVMVLPRGMDIHHFTPLQKPADDIHSDIITTHFDYHSISSRLVKLDILGHDDPTVLKMLQDLTGIDPRKIPIDDPQVMSLFRGTEAIGINPDELGSNLGTLGVPEFGTKFVRQMLADTKPQNFSDLVRISGLSHGTDVWLNNAQELIKSQTATVSEVISTRDDIMTYLIYQGLEPGIAFKIMEDVRKGKGVKNDYIQYLKETDVPEWYINSCQKIKYLFPKAHAAAYVMSALRIAYYKVYYPTAFYASFFSVRADEFDADIVVGGIPTIKKHMEEIQGKGSEATQKEEKLYTILELALEMYLRKIKLFRVDLLRSDASRFLIDDEGQALLPPLISLQGLGDSAAHSIVRARDEKCFSSREDLRIRAKISKTVLEVLDKHGCLNDLPENDQISLF